jgi:hypothetical protein
MSHPLKAAELAAMLGHEIFDVEDAAKFLGLAPATIWQQAARRRIAYVQYKNHKYFALTDLCDYAAGRGRRSNLRGDAPVEMHPLINGQRV